MKLTRWGWGILGVAALLVSSTSAQAWPFHHCCGCRHHCCEMHICCRPYNAFTPICCGNLFCDGCCPNPCAAASGCCAMPSYGCGMPAPCMGGFDGCGYGACVPGACDAGPMMPPSLPPVGAPLPPGPATPVAPTPTTMPPAFNHTAQYGAPAMPYGVWPASYYPGYYYGYAGYQGGYNPYYQGGYNPYLNYNPYSQYGIPYYHYTFGYNGQRRY